MSININSKLVSFAQNELVLGYSDKERERINVSIEQIKKVLKNKLGEEIREILLFGSYTRNTIIPRKYDRKSDIDLMIIFNIKDTVKKPARYRMKLKLACAQAYQKSFYSVDSPAVKLLLNHIKFDLVPAYTEDFPYTPGKYYYIPDKYEEWQSTEPNDINPRLSSLNQEYGNNVIRNVLRLCKHWNASAGYPLESYTMEKQIIEQAYWFKEDTYNRFLITINNIAGTMPKVKLALSQIERYKDDMFRNPDEQKQFNWLCRLLPGLRNK